MSSQPLTKKQHARQFAELMVEASEKRAAWTVLVAQERAARDAGSNDLMLENAKLDADEDYKIALSNLLTFLLLTSYVPPLAQ